jgi:hypothetical protein
MEDKLIIGGILAIVWGPRLVCVLGPIRVGLYRIALLVFGALQVMLGLFLCVAVAHAGSAQFTPALIAVLGMSNLWRARSHGEGATFGISDL